METALKKYNTIGCCGIDCGLCPRFYTSGDSKCPGCGGIDFKQKHPSCGFVTCCVTKKGLEVCSDCLEYPCPRFDSEKKGYDSFVSHKKVFTNLDFIKTNKIKNFIEQQKIRMNILNKFLTKYDTGRSKSFFCQACTLLPIEKLKDAQNFMEENKKLETVKEKNKILKDELQKSATFLLIDLNLNTKSS